MDWIQDPASVEAQLRRWRCGCIWVQRGQLESIDRRRWPRHPSVSQVWIQGRFRRPAGDVCRLDYHQPWGMSGVLTLDYILSGNQATYRTFAAACQLLDIIAKIRGSMTIVAHVSNASISDRLLRRLGWDRHLEQEAGRHWIKRFYDGYPSVPLSRFLQIAKDQATCELATCDNGRLASSQ